MKYMLLIIVVALSGCARFPLDRVEARLICQDYANAWARDANSKGIEAGVVWYETDALLRQHGAQK